MRRNSRRPSRCNNRRDKLDISPFIVSDTRFETRRRGYSIGEISRVDIKRTPFFMLLPINIGFMALVMFFSSLIYADEKLLIILFVLTTSVATWYIGVIHLTGYNITGAAAFGFYPKMRRVTDELIDVMSSSNRSNNRQRRM